MNSLLTQEWPVHEMTISHSTEWERPGIGLNFLLADKQEVRRREYGDPKLRSSALDAIQGQFRQRRLLSAQELVCSMERDGFV